MQQTSAVRSSIASAKRSAGIVPSASGRTWTTSAPRSSCACAIWPTVGNSYSLITIRFRSPSSGSADDERADPLGDGRRDGDVVRVGVEQARDRRAERLVPLDPEVPLGPVRVPAGELLLDGVADAVRERALRARVEVGRCLEDRELAPDRGADAARRGRRAHPAIVAPPCGSGTSAHRPRYAFRRSSFSSRSAALPSSTMRPVDRT